MTKEATKQDWIKDLRSGKFKRTTGTLGVPYAKAKPTVEVAKAYYFSDIRLGAINKAEVKGNCCLGVLCNTMGLAPSIYILDETFSYSSESILYYDQESLERTKEGSMGNFRPCWMSEGQEYACTTANDTLNWSFTKIADWIEGGFGYISAEVLQDGYSEYVNLSMMFSSSDSFYPVHKGKVKLPDIRAFKINESDIEY